MTVTAMALRELHRIYRQLADLQGRLDRGPKQIAARKVNLTRLDASLAETQDDLKSAKMTSDRKQVDLKSGEAKINDLDFKLNSCKTNKEYQALKDQIAAAQMANSVLADEILEGMEEIDAQGETVKKAQNDVVVAKAELAKVENEVNATAESIRADIGRLKAELAEAEAELPEDFRPDYERIVKTRGEEAMAPLDRDHCGGCYQSMTPNQLNSLKMGRSVYCSGCGRFIYMPE